jgi:hypothetical protein
MKKWLYLLLLVPSLSFAGPYVEFGIAKADGGTCISDVKIETGKLGCSESPLGNATIGYSYKGFAIEIEHWSSLVEKDKGLNLFTFKYRYEFNKK